MVHLRGEFDAVTGRRIGNRLRAEAARMHDADKKGSGDSGERRSFDQCMADALDQLTAATHAGGSLRSRSHAGERVSAERSAAGALESADALVIAPPTQRLGD